MGRAHKVPTMPSSATPRVSPERLMQFTFGFAPPLMIETAIRCGIFDILGKGTRPLDALCVETGTSPRGLRMVLDALVGLDLLSKIDAGHYGLTRESATFLVTGKPTYHGAFFLLTKGRCCRRGAGSKTWSEADSRLGISI